MIRKAKKGVLLPADALTRDIHVVGYNSGAFTDVLGRVAGTLREVRNFVENELELPTGAYQLVRYYDQFMVEEVSHVEVNWVEQSDEPPTEDLEDPDIKF